MFAITRVQISLTSDWVSDSGLIGFLNCLDVNKGEYKILDGLGRGVEFDSSILDGFEKKYYQYLQDKYEKFTSCYRLLSFKDDSMELKNKEEITDKDIDKLNTHIKFIKGRFHSKSSYSSICKILTSEGIDLIKEANGLKEITKEEVEKDSRKTILERLEIIDRIIDIVEQENIKKQFLIKDFIYNHIKHYYNPDYFSDKDKVSDLQKFKETFINPAKSYIEISNDEKEKYVYRCCSCGNPIKTIDKKSTTTPIQNIGVDGGRKASHFWNYNRDDLLCPICNLTHACIPLGFTHLKKQGIFINENISVEKLLNSNKHIFDESANLDELEYSSYMKVANVFEHANITNFKKELQNIQVIRYNNGKYKFNNLTSGMLKIMYQYKNEFKLLLGGKILHYTTSDEKIFINMFTGVVDKMYTGESLFPLIVLGIKRSLEGEYIDFNKIKVILKINMYLKKGGNNVNCERSEELLESLDNLGRALRYIYKREQCENKIDGITYTMLNAITSKNKKKLQEIFIRSYLYLGLNIPYEISEAMRDTEMWQDYGMTFICGFRGSYKGDDTSTDTKEQNETNNLDRGNNNE